MNRNNIRVHVIKYEDRKNYLLSYVDPRTGKRVSRSAKTSNRRKAERAASQWETELRQGAYCKSDNVSWDSFRERYEQQVKQEQAETTLIKVISVFNSVERICAPRRLYELDEQRLLHFKDELIRANSVNTAISYLAHLRSALNTAVEWGMLARRPKLPNIKRGKASS